MDVVTQSLLKEFTESQKIGQLPQPQQFESFINYIIVSDIYPEEFDFNIIAAGEGEFGIDGIAIIVNDAIVEDEEQVEDIISHNSSLQVQFLFIQAKSGASFDSGELSKFLHAVLDFFGKDSKLAQSPRILELQRVKNRLYEAAAKFVRGLPKASLYYASTGTWTDDKNLCAIRDGFLAQAQSTHIFSTIGFNPIDAARIQKLYFQTKNAFRTTIDFPQNIPLPLIPNVRESYIGILPLSEYLKMITDGDGNVRHCVANAPRFARRKLPGRSSAATASSVSVSFASRTSSTSSLADG